MSQYHAYFKEGKEHIRMEILFASCNVNFRFHGVGLDNVQIIIDDKRGNLNHHLYFIPQKNKLSNLGDALYISRQRMVDIITKDDVVIWNRFEGDPHEKNIITIT